MKRHETTQNARFPVPPEYRRVLLFGGSFDPPHRAHFELPELVRTRLGLDWIVYVPAHRSPHKADAPLASAQDRVNMLNLGLGDSARASVWTIEVDGAHKVDQPSFTIDTVREALRQRPEVSLRLLIGSDQAREFHRWRAPSELLHLAPPAVMLRDGGAEEGDESRLVNDLCARWPGDAGRRWASWIVHVPAIEVSATRVRALLADPCAPEHELRALIPGPVLGYIRERGLYQAK